MAARSKQPLNPKELRRSKRIQKRHERARAKSDSTGNNLNPAPEPVAPQNDTNLVPSEQECAICSVSVSMERLIRLDACTHPAQICGECTANWIQEQVASSTWDRIRCPTDGCDVVISHSEIKQHATVDVFNR